MTDGSVCRCVDIYEKYFLKWLACLPLSSEVTGSIPAACVEFGKNQSTELQTRIVIKKKINCFHVGTESTAGAGESWTPTLNTRGSG